VLQNCGVTGANRDREAKIEDFGFKTAWRDLFLVFAMVSTSPAKYWPADDPHVSYEGRVACGPDHQVRMGFPGIVTRLRVDATSVNAKILASSDDVYFNLVLDDCAPRRLRLKKGLNDVVLLSETQPGAHNIELVRRTESWEGVCEIVGISVEEGTFLDPLPLPSSKLMFIGDSITCGEGTEPSDIDGKPGAERSNAEASFCMKLARRLKAQCNLVSYGGRGIIRDWQGIRDTNNAPQFYEFALPDDPNARWDSRKYVPDVVGICLGTNDFSQGVPDQNEFVNGYAEFIRKIMRDAPKARIILIDSPILTDGEGQIPKKKVCRAFLEEILRKIGSKNVSLAWVRHYLGSPGDGHPTGAEHTLIADELESAFRGALLSETG
jgi:lysophospholipase L1-like esterase